MTDTASLQRTPLYALHLEQGAKLVPFAGYEMPVNYGDGIIKEHLHTRSAAGLFDVSHMGQITISGANAAQALEALIPADIVSLAPGRQKYGLFTTPQGGIIDDLMVQNLGDHYQLVVNAACKQQDLEHLRQHLGASLDVSFRNDLALLALQGPAAAEVMQALGQDCSDMKFLSVRQFDVTGIPCTVSRSGYTGEDGFEISMPVDRAETLARTLLDQPGVKPVGLGARDSLRLEAGLCLYGHDITTDTTPVEAGLRWAISPARRAGGVRPGGFPGDRIILQQLESGVTRQRVGLAPEGRAPVREGVTLIADGGDEAGVVTSGGFSPSLERPVAMGYVARQYGTAGTTLQALVRNRQMPVTVTTLPFVPARYLR